MKCEFKESCGYDFCLEEECSEYEAVPKTNGDLIRGMSDKELAKWLLGLNTGCECSANGVFCECSLENGCEENILKWLQQPAEVDE